MGKLDNVSPRDLIRLVEAIGFQQTRQTGSHLRFVHADGRKATIPLHSGKTIGIGLLIKIIKKDL
ncbi:MAG: type II toxin-antitoxin system HicA family toxin, partial [Candidatus Diapherotrites archaeon]|nr:type II toxin-antitoxin system HicA family toxin [Candidatus Diapherotrites archaeon]